MAEASRPQFVLFGSSIVQISYANGGWGAILSDIYARKVDLGAEEESSLVSVKLPEVSWSEQMVKKLKEGQGPKAEDTILYYIAKKADIKLRGYFGWNSRRALQVLDKVFPKDSAIQPSLVIVYFGGNDSMGPHSSGLGPHVPLPEYVENMKKIAIHLKSLSDTKRIIFLSCPPVNEAKVRENTSEYFSELVRTNELCKNYSEACVELCRDLGIKVVDLFTAIQERDDWMDACFTDGIHLSAEGSKIVVKGILKVLKEAEWEPSLHWKSMPTEFGEDSPYDLVAADGKTTINPSEWTYHRKIKWD